MDPDHVPDNIREFNTIVGSILAQLYPAFPKLKTLYGPQVLDVFGPCTGVVLTHLNEMFIQTLAWLIHEGYVRAEGLKPTEGLVLTEKGLRAMNVIPEGLHKPIGSQLVENSKGNTSDGGRKIADIVGGFFGSAMGSFSKSIGGG